MPSQPDAPSIFVYSSMLGASDSFLLDLMMPFGSLGTSSMRCCS